MEYTWSEMEYYLSNFKEVDKKVEENDYIIKSDRAKDGYALIIIERWLATMARLQKDIIELKFFKNHTVDEITRKRNYEKSSIYNFIKQEKKRLFLLLNT